MLLYFWCVGTLYWYVRKVRHNMCYYAVYKGDHNWWYQGRSWYISVVVHKVRVITWFTCHEAYHMLRYIVHTNFLEMKNAGTNSSNFEPSQSQIQIYARDHTSFDDFLSHLKDPRVYESRDPLLSWRWLLTFIHWSFPPPKIWKFRNFCFCISKSFPIYPRKFFESLFWHKIRLFRIIRIVYWIK